MWKNGAGSVAGSGDRIVAPFEGRIFKLLNHPVWGN